MSAAEGTEGLLLGFLSLHCILLLGFWPLGMPVRGRGCRTGLLWLAWDLGCTQTQKHSLGVPVGILWKRSVKQGCCSTRGSCR